MNFRPRNKNFISKNNTSTNIFLPIIAVFLFIVIFSIPITRNLLFSVGSPIWSAKNSINSFFLNNFGIINSKISLLNENIFLRSQIQAKEKDYALFDLLKKENEDLKNILNRIETDQKSLLTAILVKPFLSPYDTLIVDTGINNGVGVGDKVLADGNVFIGYVSEVYNNTSKVTLYSSPGEKVAVLIGGNNIEKEAIGLGEGNFKVEIPREIDVKEGDTIVFPSISSNIFGLVEKVDFKETSAFQNVLFKNPVNISELKWVEILISNKK